MNTTTAKPIRLRTGLLFFILLAIILVHANAQENSWNGKPVNLSHGKLVVSANHRFLMHEDGTPFFYLADTAWELFHRLNDSEIDLYLENRRAKGFTVIQAVILAELNGLNTPNRNGDKPLTDNNPETPHDRYFQWIDKVIRKAAAKGMYIGLLPTWGDKVDQQWGTGPVIFNPENAAVYGQFLGRRYRNFPNIIWIIGGDRSGENNYDVWDSMAKAIKSEDKNHLMTFHPLGEHSSSFWFHHCDWLDFNMCQTGHSQRSYDIYRKLVVADYNRVPVKPCMDGEPRYEDHPVAWLPDVYGWFDYADVRQSLYWNLFSGACGHTYGCHPVWQFKRENDAPVGNARHNWQEVLDLDGASSLIHARRLLESFDFESRRPDPGMIIGSRHFATDMPVALRGKDYALVYLPNGNPIEVALDRIPGSSRLKLQWYNTRNGKYSFIKITEAQGVFHAIPESYGRGNDWVLVMKKE